VRFRLRRDWLRLRRALRRRPPPYRGTWPAEPDGCSDWVVPLLGSHGPGPAIAYPDAGVSKTRPGDRCEH